MSLVGQAAVALSTDDDHAVANGDQAQVTSERVLRAIRHLMQRTAMHSKALAKEAGLTAPQVLCLRAVAELPPERCTVVHVAEHAALPIPTASRLLARLVDAGYLRREHAPRDRRKVFMALTDEGAAKLEGPLRTMQERFVAHFERLDAHEREQLLEAVTRLTEMVDPIDAEG